MDANGSGIFRDTDGDTATSVTGEQHPLVVEVENEFREQALQRFLGKTLVAVGMRVEVLSGRYKGKHGIVVEKLAFEPPSAAVLPFPVAVKFDEPAPYVQFGSGPIRGDYFSADDLGPSGVEVDPWRKTIAAWLTTKPARSLLAKNELRTGHIMGALGLSNIANNREYEIAAATRVGDIMRGLGYVRLGSKSASRRFYVWVMPAPRFESGDEVTIVAGEHKGDKGRVLGWMRSDPPDDATPFFYIVSLEKARGELKFKEAELLPAASAKGGGGGAAVAVPLADAPPPEKGVALDVLLQSFLTWLLGVPVDFTLLLAMATSAFEAQLEAERADENEKAKVDPTLAEANVRAKALWTWLRDGTGHLSQLHAVLEQKKISDIDELYLTGWPIVAPRLFGGGSYPLAMFTVAAVRRELGMSPQMDDLERSPSAAGWVLVLDRLARGALERAGSAMTNDEDRERFEKDAKALTWIVDAAGGIPGASDAVSAPSGYIETDVFEGVKTESARLHSAISEAWVDAVLEPLIADPDCGEALYNKTRLSVQLALTQAWERRLPRDLSEFQAADTQDGERSQ